MFSLPTMGAVAPRSQTNTCKLDDELFEQPSADWPTTAKQLPTEIAKRSISGEQPDHQGKHRATKVPGPWCRQRRHACHERTTSQPIKASTATSLAKHWHSASRQQDQDNIANAAQLLERSSQTTSSQPNTPSAQVQVRTHKTADHEAPSLRN